jgi:hypothetical protein
MRKQSLSFEILQELTCQASTHLTDGICQPLSVWAGPSPSTIAHSSLWQFCIFLELHTGEQYGNVLEEKNTEHIVS